MKKILVGTLIALTVGAVPALAADEAVSATHTAAASDCTALFKKLDVNRDGKITRGAAASYPSISKAFNDPQTAKRGYLTPAEFQEACMKGAAEGEPRG